MLSVLIANAKGGCGKTTLATNIAAAFSVGGRRTLLADADRQRSSLAWLDRRPKSSAPIGGLDWSKGADGTPPPEADCLVIDGAAGMRRREMEELVRLADVVVVPVLPSAFDETGTRRFLDRLNELKPIRRNRVPVAVVRNRVRDRTIAAAQLDLFLLGVGSTGIARIPDRTLYTEAAARGLSVFDLTSARAAQLRHDWRPLLRFIESSVTGS
jgi:chromosome partitioning protein